MATNSFLGYDCTFVSLIVTRRKSIQTFLTFLISKVYIVVNLFLKLVFFKDIRNFNIFFFLYLRISLIVLGNISNLSSFVQKIVFLSL